MQSLRNGVENHVNMDQSCAVMDTSVHICGTHGANAELVEADQGATDPSRGELRCFASKINQFREKSQKSLCEESQKGVSSAVVH